MGATDTRLSYCSVDLNSPSEDQAFYVCQLEFYKFLVSK